MIWLVTIQDKDLYGEPDIGVAVIEAVTARDAVDAARPTIEQLADQGRGRCVPHAREVELGKIYRLSALVRLPPRDRDVP
jgi:hypothetical protein